MIKATSDIFIKYLLGTERNKICLLSFINAVLEDSQFPPIASVNILNPFNPKLAEPEPIHCIVHLTTSEKITQTC